MIKLFKIFRISSNKKVVGPIPIICYFDFMRKGNKRKSKIKTPIVYQGKTLIISEEDFSRVVPWWLCLPFMPYFQDAMILGHYGTIEYRYDDISELPKRYQKLV